MVELATMVRSFPSLATAVLLSGTSYSSSGMDCPSGLDCNTGEPLGSSASADLTITFAVSKTGLVNEKGAPLCGRVITVPIGLPRDAYRRKGLWPPDAKGTSGLANAVKSEAPAEAAAPAEEKDGGEA